MQEEFTESDRRSEALERQALVSLHESCSAVVRRELGLALHEVGDGLVAVASNDQSVLLNRTLGLGLNSPVAPETLDQVRKIYSNAGVARPLVHIYSHTVPAPESLGFSRARGWRKFARGGEALKLVSRPCELRIERVGPAKALDFGRVVAPAFGMSESAAQLLAGLADDERWYLFVSYAGDRPAGAGAMMLMGTSAWFEWGATSPEFRQRGSQGAIMRARLAAATDAGCEAMFTETGEAVPGDPQHSYRNIERYGFRPGLLRENWVPALD